MFKVVGHRFGNQKMNTNKSLIIKLKFNLCRRPGKIILHSKTNLCISKHQFKPISIIRSKDVDHSFDVEIDLATCPRCHQENSTRKVKCRKCDASLRPPTPMKEINFFF